MIWRDYVFDIGRVQLEVGQWAQTSCLAEQLGIEVNPYARPADEPHIIVIPGRFSPRDAMTLSEPAKVTMRFIKAHHDRYAWTLPRIDSGNVSDFMYYHHRLLSHYDPLYQRTLAAKP